MGCSERRKRRFCAACHEETGLIVMGRECRKFNGVGAEDVVLGVRIGGKALFIVGLLCIGFGLTK